MGKKRQRQQSSDDSSSDDEPVTVRRSEEEEPEPKKSKWINKQRVLVFGCRGLSFRDRHLVSLREVVLASLVEFTLNFETYNDVR